MFVNFAHFLDHDLSNVDYSLVYKPTPVAPANPVEKFKPFYYIRSGVYVPADNIYTYEYMYVNDTFSGGMYGTYSPYYYPNYKMYCLVDEYPQFSSSTSPSNIIEYKDILKTEPLYYNNKMYGANNFVVINKNHAIIENLTFIGSEALNIEVPMCDKFFDKECAGNASISFYRSNWFIRNKTRTIMNSNTAWIDASQIYGVNKTSSDAVR
jgi:hypothetical protein